MTTKDPSAKPGLIPNFTQQTLLYQFMTTFIEERPNIQKDRRFLYNNVFRTTPGEKTSIAFLQRLNNPNAQYLLQSVPKEILSTLQPIIELYRVSPDGKEEFLLPFNNFQDPQKFGIFNSVPGHLAVGLKDFSFDYLGTNPEEVDFKIKANLRLYFSSMDALFHEYRDKKGNRFSFSDLINRKKQVSGNKKDNTSHLSYVTDGFRTRISVRYLLPDDDFLREAVKGLKLKVSPSSYIEELKNALRHSDVSFFLNLARHEIDYQMDSPTMPFELSLEYWASAEVKFLSDEANLIALRAPEKKQEEDFTFGDTAVEEYKKFLEDEPNFRALDSVKRDQIWINPKGGTLEPLWRRRHRFRLEPTTIEIKDPELQKLLTKTLGGDEPIEFDEKGVAELDSESFAKIQEYFDLRRDARVEEGAGLASRKEEAYTRMLNKLIEKNALHRVKMDPMDVQNWVEKKRTWGHNSRQKDLKKKLKKEGDVEGVRQIEKDKEETAFGYYETAQNIIRQIKDTDKVATPNASLQKKLNILRVQLATVKKDKNPNDLSKAGIKQLEEEIKAIEKKIQEKQSIQAGTLTDKQYDTTGIISTTINHTFGGGLRDINQGRIKTQPRFEVDFLYLGDLIDVAIQILKELEPVRMKQYFEEQSRVILSDVEILNPLTGQRQTINIGDIPVSLELWNSVWVTRVIKPAASVYAFRTFLRDIVTRVIPNAFTQKNLANGEVKNRVKGDVEFFSVGKGEIPRIDARLSPTKKGPDILTATIQVNKSSRRSETAVVLYATTNEPANLRLNKKQDIENGIYYLDVGTEGSPIHSINFSKQNIPGYLEAQIESSGRVGDDIPFSEPYNAAVSMLGNTFMRPGRSVVIRLPHIGDVKRLKSNSRLLGLGGYFKVIKATNRLSEFGNRVDWKTEVEALHYSFGDDEARPVETNPYLLGQQEQTNRQAATNVGASFALPSAPSAGLSDAYRDKKKIEKELDRASISGAGDGTTTIMD